MGGNLGNVIQTFILTQRELQKFGNIVEGSSIYSSKAWGMGKDTPDFYNQAIVLETALSPELLLKSLLEVERNFGRKRNNEAGYSSRELDLDIIFYGNKIIKTNVLEIPHPRMHLRNFTLEPLVEIIPQFIHPVLGKTIKELSKSSPDQEKVTKC